MALGRAQNVKEDKMTAYLIGALCGAAVYAVGREVLPLLVRKLKGQVEKL